jgi:hypothetical protein
MPDRMTPAANKLTTLRPVSLSSYLLLIHAVRSPKLVVIAPEQYREEDHEKGMSAEIGGKGKV